ncbi:MAG: DUF99 family protein [Candidatus Bathyarchaeia archaeon]
MIKREARILGLSAHRKGRTILVVGVVFRGSLWLDGVISCLLEMNGTNQNSTLSGTIKRSKQYSQLHAIIVKKQLALGFELDLDDLARRVNLPVITITNRHISKAPKKGMSQRRLQHYDIIVNGHHLSVLAVRISRVGVQQVFKVGCGPTSSIPEAVRVANLLVQESSRCRFLWQRRKLKIGPSHTRHPRIKSV